MDKIDDLKLELKAMERIAKILHDLPTPDAVVRVTDWLQGIIGAIVKDTGLAIDSSAPIAVPPTSCSPNTKPASNNHASSEPSTELV